MKVGIKQIAELAGISPATVSNVLNHKKGVSKKTMEQVLRVARETGYLKENCIKTIKLVIYKKHGMVVGETPFFHALIEGVEKECRSRGFALEICGLNRESADFADVLDGLLQDYTAAILLLATELDEEDMKPFIKAVSPVAVLDSWFPALQFNSVLINNVDAVRQAVSHLIEAGHRQIGHLKSNVVINNFEFRKEGYVSALAQKELIHDLAFTIDLTPTMEGAYLDMAAYLKNDPTLPTAYFADNDIIALGAIKALKQHGVKVPQDVSVIGFDDMPFCEISSPRLTTIRVHKHELGAQAVKCLCDEIQHKSKGCIKLEVCTEFVERDSVERKKG